MSFVELDDYVSPIRQVFQHPARQPRVVGDETCDLRLVETEFGRPFALLLESPSHHRVAVRHPQEDQAVQRAEERSVLARQRFVDVTPPMALGIRFGFKRIDRLIEPVRRLWPCADAPTLEQNDVGRCLHFTRFAVRDCPSPYRRRGP